MCEHEKRHTMYDCACIWVALQRIIFLHHIIFDVQRFSNVVTQCRQTIAERTYEIYYVSM